ncbi:AraC family transcriptional regulator [Flavobacterium sp. AS60]|uniref:helix-turn-helix transcriptional regulator n=1 Tax=Flavobacterium anseongense TaxID=2910677 RepID=UPI001F43D6C7|nr:AraC family transcriptional regulator [Flavobacterium sp. AS60]MCF6128053.1 AraC family transcriptional regulator [Flavobacterium sp. AS60]
MNKAIFSDSKGNEIRLSSAMQADQEVAFQNFSAKYVVSGNENYIINNRKIAVKQGEYLIGNKNTTSKVLIDTVFPVKGICIDIAKEYITEIIDYQFETPSTFSEFLFEQEWVSQKYNVENTSLGYALHQLANEFENLNSGLSKIDNELFYAVAECIVKDQSNIYQSFSRLKAAKQETTGRLFNFCCDAKNYIDNNFLEKISIEQIANEAKLSEYHFIRLFKTIFNITPYQYIIQKRLTYSKDLLLQKISIQDTAFLTSFADSASYCKAFKSAYGFTPKEFVKVN